MITENDRHDEDPAGGQGGVNTDISSQPNISKGEHSDLVDLTEKEQKNPIAWKWALRDLSRLREIENKYLMLKDDYALLDKDYAVYKAKSLENKVYDIISSAFLAIGPILLGLVPVTFEMDPKYVRWILLGIGVAMLSGAIYVKSLTYKK